MTTTFKSQVLIYLRKSTKKKEQEQSIEKQKYAIYILAEKLGINKKDMEFFIDEGYSGFKGCVYITSNKITRQRKDFTKMLNTVKKANTPCKILVYDYSRLTRNIIDYVEVVKYLGFNSKQTNKIEGIYFANGAVWNSSTSQGTMIDNVNDSLKYSERVSINITNGREVRLKNGLFPNDIRLPRGIEKGSTYLKLGEEMQIIKKAFEMKASGNSNKDIHIYLKKNNINISLSHIADRLWKNRFYIGEYTLNATQEKFNLKFEGNILPIPLLLFNSASDNIGLKKGKYGANQKDDIIANLLKTDSGKKFTGYTPKDRKSRQYLNDREKIYISQNIIFDEFYEIINRISYLHYNIVLESLYLFDEEILIEIEKSFISRGLKFTDKVKKDFFDRHKKICSEGKYLEKIGYENFDFLTFDNSMYVTYYNLNKIIKLIIDNKDDCDKCIDQLMYMFGIDNEDKEGFTITLEYYLEVFNKSYEKLKLYIINNGNKEIDNEKEVNREYVEKIKKEKELLEKQVKTAKSNAIFQGYSREDLESAIKEPLNNIDKLNNEIEEIENTILNENDLNTFISIIEKIFEHTIILLGKANKGDITKEYLHLIKMITFELTINTKKELKIKLFEGIDKLLFAYGTPMENGTPVPALRRPCPNH